jgi:stearoyl-CoA desaturase (Delta-9 desaturase)
MYPSAILFLLVHLGCFAVFWTGVTSDAIAICLESDEKGQNGRPES